MSPARKKSLSAPLAASRGADAPAEVSPKTSSAGEPFYPKDYIPSVLGGWLRIAAQQENVTHAILILAERLAIMPHSEPARMSMPDNHKAWEQASIRERMQWIKLWLMRECNDIGDRAEIRRLKDELNRD